VSYENFRQKYRPKFFSEVVGSKNQKIAKILINIIKSGRIPPGIIFHGPPGSGKTTLALLLIKGLLCENFSGDVCGKCAACLSFERNISAPIDYFYHDCTQITGKEVDKIIESLKTLTFTKSKLHIHFFDEFHRAREPVLEKFLTILERMKDILLIFALIDLNHVGEAFRQRVTTLKTYAPGIDELLPWLRRICALEGITVVGDNALRQLAQAAGQLPRECLGFLEKVSLRGEPLTTSLVKELERDIEADPDH
jgi:DNA polymerase III gamma/tau subunit